MADQQDEEQIRNALQAAIDEAVHRLDLDAQNLQLELLRQELEQHGPLPDNPRMFITNIERQQALAIKQAVEADEELDNLTDFQYVQAAMADEDDVEAAVQRAKHVQAFRKEYNVINGNVDDAISCMETFLRILPGVMLSISYNSDDGNYILLMNQAAFDQTALSDEQLWRANLVSFYFTMDALNPDFFAIRKGIVYLIDCDGYDWKNLDMHTIERMWVEILNAYPAIYQQIKYFHTGVFANLMASLMKRFLPERIHSVMQLGCRFEGRLASYYLVPTLEAANERILERLQICLRRRCENERTFRL